MKGYIPTFGVEDPLESEPLESIQWTHLNVYRLFPSKVSAFIVFFLHVSCAVKQTKNILFYRGRRPPTLLCVEVHANARR